MTTPAWIGLGSNLGDRKSLLDVAVAALTELPGTSVKAISSYHETRPVGGPSGQGPFLNAAVRIETHLDPYQLLEALQEIETRAGRVREVRWGERTLDLDLLIFGCKFLNTPELSLPHPRLCFRRFVLIPLVEIAPRIVETVTMRTIAELLDNLDRTPRLVAIEGPPGPFRSKVFRRLVEELSGFGVEWGNLIASLDRFESPIIGFSDFFERKIEALRVDRWSADPAHAPWFVTDFRLGQEIRRFEQNPVWVPAARGPTDVDHRAHNDLMDRIRVAAIETLEPCFVVVLPEDRSKGRGPGIKGPPLLWPDSDDPDAIVDEVVATCRSIEGL